MMHRILHFLLKSISRLPMFVWYGLANILYLLMWYLLGYRKKVVIENLTHSFPEKSSKELQQIAKKFYRNLADYVVESIKSLSISQKELDKRHTYENLEIFAQHKADGRNVIMLAGHVFNWEWLTGVVEQLASDHTFAVYHKVSNSFFDEVMNENRSRFGTTPITMQETPRTVLKTPNDGNATFLFVADQSPLRSKIQYGVQFLNQPTPAIVGFDKLCRKLNLAVVYCDTQKIKQGKYHTRFVNITPKNEKFEPNEVVDQFFSLLEKTIQQQPHNWLWSHKRWKHKDVL